MKIRHLWLITSFIFLIFILYINISTYINKRNIVVIPNISNLDNEEIINELDKLDIKYIKEYTYNTTIPFTIPHEGMSIYKNKTIKLFLPLNKKNYYKDFKGLSIIDYKEEIIDYCKYNNLNYNFEYIECDEIPNIIIDQSKSINEEVVENSNITFYIAKNNNYYLLPDFNGMNIKDAINILNELELEYEIIYFNTIFDSNIVLNQSIIPNTFMKKGNKNIIKLYVSNY